VTLLGKVHLASQFVEQGGDFSARKFTPEAAQNRSSLFFHDLAKLNAIGAGNEVDECAGLDAVSIP